MSTAHEVFYECTFASGGEEWSMSVRAWDARAAEKLFREELARLRVGGPGQVQVRGPVPRMAQRRCHSVRQRSPPRRGPRARPA